MKLAMSPPTKKRLVHFDKEGYQAALKKQDEKKAKLKRMIEEARKFITLPDKDINEFRTRPQVYFENGVLKKYEGKNPMGLSASKVMELLELPVEMFYKCADAYLLDPTDEDKPIFQEDYEQIAETKEQIARYEKSMALISAITELHKDRQQLNRLVIASMSHGTIVYGWDGEWRVGADYVMNG